MDIKKKSILKVTVPLHLLQKHFTFFNESLMQVQVQCSGHGTQTTGRALLLVVLAPTWA